MASSGRGGKRKVCPQGGHLKEAVISQGIENPDMAFL
jgi:hypothetical protein